MTYGQAAATCASFGLTLCTASCFNTGCSYNSHPVFSQLPCPNPPPRAPPPVPPPGAVAPESTPQPPARLPQPPESVTALTPPSPPVSDRLADSPDVHGLPTWTVATLAASGVVISASCCAFLLLYFRAPLRQSPLLCVTQFLVLVQLVVALALTIIAMKAASCAPATPHWLACVCAARDG